MPAKQRTKGQKEIYIGNEETKSYYMRMSIIASCIQIVCILLSIILGLNTGILHIIGCVLCCLVHYGAYRIFLWIATPYFSPDGQLLDGGIDLSIPNGTGEHMKDAVIFIALLQIGTLITNYAWLLVLIVPGRILYLIWPYLKGLLQAGGYIGDTSHQTTGGLEQEGSIPTAGKRKKEKIKKVYHK